MMKYLPIGTVVQLNNGQVKLMIVSRFPLYDNQREIGYFDYSGCIYPQGTADNQFYYFNEEDIKTIWFEGYVDGQEEEYRKIARNEVGKITYPRFTLENIKN
ncbi:DUF4176 domain-containing protein [Streptococcus suis]|uniref:DUF4176 domain-containing protein n=1 Tax=Streptococcus suis TaxID=1307 RepID=UPI00192D903C|nr:DUF4176 domain-containing protein [Streptococcus suis]MBL6503070.1 DUF4176 domain-containing protein [Streptococcus suis]MBM0241715.1 DUF4176 domain-containing protein [Streptococcus suis]MBO4116562.1 DUF4176 domain-containing protein [Streptococcus suis]MBO4117991.1 DUF4176 domain-containing protein [Streptococcus suis]MBO4125018.1 DUF4176 domain-containing protein [Streptococcus suis]